MLLQFAAIILVLGFIAAPPVAAADCTDGDGDGYVDCTGCTLPAGKSCNECDDGNAAIHPGATERCDDAIDSNCDGDPNDPYPNLGQDCAHCTGPDCPSSFCIASGTNLDCNTFTGALCLTASLASDGNGIVCGGDGMSEACTEPPEAPIAQYEAEGLGSGNVGNYTEPTCSDGQDNDCDDVLGDGTSVDLGDSGCWAPELCNGLDDDGDGFVDEDFPLSSPDNVGHACQVGIGECQRTGVYGCLPDGSDAVCSASPGAEKNEGTQFGNSCDDGKDNNCDGLTDLADPACAGFGQAELCGNSLDDDGDGLVDEGFPTIGQACSAGTGACRTIGALVCNGAGTGTECDAVPGAPAEESESAGTCGDFIDNDCNGFTDAADAGCGAAYADLGATCSLPYTVAKPGDDCTGKHTIEFGSAQGDVKADLLALDADGSLLGIIEDVQPGDLAHLASRVDPLDFQYSSKTNKQGTRHTVWAPMPLLRVTATSGSIEDVAYCGIMPYLEVTSPDGQTLSLSEGSALDVKAFLPLVDVDSLSLSLNGIDILSEIGLDPMADFPTHGTPLCSSPGDCVFQIEAGCGDGSMVDVQILNLMVEGLDTDEAATAKDGVGTPDQVNTLSFNVSGLPPGGHIFYIEGVPLPLPTFLTPDCLVDDLADAGTASAFGIQIDSPADQQVVASAPVLVEGTVCGGNEIVDFKINGHDVDVSIPGSQMCTMGNGTTEADECVVDFSEPIDETDLSQAVAGTAPLGTFKRGSNRIIADALDDHGNRTFNIDTVFGLGPVQTPAAVAGTQLSLAVESEVMPVFKDLEAALATEINPAFVVGLEESAVQDFFNEKCVGAIEEFSARAEANLRNKTFATLDAEPGCSCDLHNVPIVLESVTFTPSTANPTCAVDFTHDEIGVRINLPDIRIQVGAHRSCTTHGLFGECLARTRIDVTAVTKVQDLSFDFVITEDSIENETPPPPEAQVFAWTVVDPDGHPLFTSAGACSGGSSPGKVCYGDSACGGGTCVGAVKNASFDGVTHNGSGIECWGASICSVFQYIGAGLIEVFTLGFADGLEIVDFIDFDFEFKEDFLTEVSASQPDAMELNEVEIDKDKVASFGHAAFTPGDIDVEIEDGGLTVAFGADFMAQYDDPAIDQTPPPPATPASTPSVPQMIASADEISIMVADDVFAQMFWAMKEAGALQAFCTDLDGRTVDDLLPAEMDGGCDSLGDSSTVGGVTVQGICHAIRGADCESLTGDTDALQDTKQGVCHGASNDDCTTIPVAGPLRAITEKAACNLIPEIHIASTDGLLLCARQDMEPDLLFSDDDATDNTVDTSLLLNDTNIVFVLDRASDGYTGNLEDLDGCFGEDGGAAPDCRLYAVCLDLTLNTTMGIDNSQCSPNETGFVFHLNQVMASGIDAGVMCSAATQSDDDLVVGTGFDSQVVDIVSDAAEAFTPPFCAEGLTLGGVLDFTSASARMFAITTDGTTGFADFLGLTGGLGAPSPLLPKPGVQVRLKPDGND